MLSGAFDRDLVTEPGDWMIVVDRLIGSKLGLLTPFSTLTGRRRGFRSWR